MSKPVVRVAALAQPASRLSPPHVRTTNAAAFSGPERRQARRLWIVLAITSVFAVVQLVGAVWANSDVLRAEALHLLTDVAALAFAIVAMRIAVQKPTARFTYGLRRAEPVAAVFNALVVLGATAYVIAEAAGDLTHGGGPHADRMLYIAALGLVVNGVSAWLIHGAIGSHAHDHALPAGSEQAATCVDHTHRHIVQHADAPGHGHALNLRGAWLHLLGDALGSLAALVAALAIHFGLSARADAIATFVVAAILIYGASRLLIDAVLILLEASPSHLPVDEVRRIILEVAGVGELKDLHVWTLGAGHEAITAHVTARTADTGLPGRVERAVRARFRVEYVTIQVDAVMRAADA